MNGVPEGIEDIIPTQSFPMESNLDIMGARECHLMPARPMRLTTKLVDFRKGCYVGQELTVRTYHTGILRKRIWPVVAHATP